MKDGDFDSFVIYITPQDRFGEKSWRALVLARVFCLGLGCTQDYTILGDNFRGFKEAKSAVMAACDDYISKKFGD